MSDANDAPPNYGCHTLLEIYRCRSDRKIRACTPCHTAGGISVEFAKLAELPKSMSEFSMEILALAASALVFILLLRRNLASNKRADAALNVLLAKHTFSQLSSDERGRIELRTREIMAQRGLVPEFQGEIERYGWYALAMNELGISPQAKGFKGWKAISNPSKAIAPGDPLLNTAAFLLKKKCGIEVSAS